MSTQNGGTGGTIPAFGPRLSGSALTKTTNIEDVWITNELYRRASREVDGPEEIASLKNIAAMVQTTPKEILTALMQQALLLCPADTAGLSVLHDDDARQFFHWDAMAGVLSDKIGGTTPRKFSPCGFTMDCAENSVSL